MTSWTITKLTCIPQTAEGENYVVDAAWLCTATDGKHAGRVAGQTRFTPNADAPFIPYADLTEDIVLGWCFTQGVDKDGIEDAVAQQIAVQVNPPIVTPPLPWASSPSED